MLRFLPFLAVVLVACAAKQADQQPGYPPQEPAVGPPPPAAEPAPSPGLQQGASPPGNVLRPEGGADFTTVEDAERALEQARSDLELIGPAKAKSSGKKGEATPLARGDSACGNACKAFASMRRAADAVCRLAGESDTRCVRARSLVKENEVRVSACGCEPPKE